MAKNNKNIICIDMDGVVASMAEAAAKRLNIELPKNTTISDTWLYDNCGVDKKQFWKTIHFNEYKFWSKEITPYFWAKDLIRLIDKNFEHWIFLSKPSKNGNCHKGKFDWLNTNFGLGHKLWLSGGNKEYFAGPNKILIDDKVENCDKWSKFGGWAFRWEEFTPDIDKEKIKGRLDELEEFLKLFN